MIVTDSGYPQMNRDGDEWVLVLTRTLEHSIEEVWAALTEAEQLAAWGPFRSDRNLTAAGAVQLEHIDMPEAERQQGYVQQAEAPHLLVFRWGDDILRWELSGEGDQTVLVLRHRFADRKQAPSYAAGWHLCLDGLAGLLAGKRMPSMVGHNAYNYGYDELYMQYAKQLGVHQEAERMNEYGTLHESNGRYALRFERSFPHNPERVFSIITNPGYFAQWYPFATGEMDLRLGGKIAFDDGEGTTYEGTITELEKPYLFSFLEADDRIDLSLREEDNGCRMIFTHTFSDKSWAVRTAAGWHGCLDVLVQIVDGHPAAWQDNSAELRKIYGEAFQMEP